MKPRARKWLHWLPLILIPALSLLIFWQFSFAGAGPGFPLDDAWIHQTYARNFYESGVWAFQEGQPSAGSTSPLWTMMVLPGQLLNSPPVWWILVVGYGTMLFLILIVRNWLAERYDIKPWQLNFLAATIALEWHLVWAALSGMETLLAGSIALLFFWLLLVRKSSPWTLGAMIGLGVWVRPDLLSLAIPAVWIWLLNVKGAKFELGWPLRLGLGLATFLLPYLLLQWLLSGSPWPSTFYAKQAEYAVLRQQPWLARFGQQWLAPSAGPLVLLLPAIVYWCARRVEFKQWGGLAPILWVFIYLATFATRLPVTYQHGRYAMPVIPTLVLLGLIGLVDFISHPARNVRLRWFIDRTWAIATLTISLAFMLIGARAYAQDVAIIQTEMVEMARWINNNTDPEALIAAHDIGALGYFGGRQIVDLAGLVSPEVIPIIRDEAALADLMEARSVDYLMTFPEWYPQLVRGLSVVHESMGVASPAAGGTNMTLYRWQD